MTTVSVRYIVNDVDEAIDFYCRHLGFHEDMHPAPDLRHAVPRRSAARAQRPERRARRRPGHARRHATRTGRLEPLLPRGNRPRGTGRALRAHGARFRNDIVTGVGGKQILLEDPSGNPVELFEPTIQEARLSPPAS